MEGGQILYPGEVVVLQVEVCEHGAGSDAIDSGDEVVVEIEN